MIVFFVVVVVVVVQRIFAPYRGFFHGAVYLFVWFPNVLVRSNDILRTGPKADA